MSGGSLDYIYSRVEDAAKTIGRDPYSEGVPELRAFRDHLLKVATALHDVEWYLSGDYTKETMMESLKEVITDKHVLRSTMKEAENIIKELKEQLAICTAKKPHD